MEPLKVAAQFAAYTWFNESHAGTPTVDEATKFARKNWSAFVDDVSEGLGRLLIRVGRLDAPKAAPRPRRVRSRASMGAAG
jgi:hypothetical protein